MRVWNRLGIVPIAIVMFLCLALTGCSDGATSAESDGGGLAVLLGLHANGDAGGGSVKSSPASIDCMPLCSAQFPEGTQVNLVATPNPGFAFMGWDGDCSGSSPSCNVTLSAPKSVGFLFSVPDPSLSALAVSAGTLSPAFAPATTVYTLVLPQRASSVQLTPTAADPTATIQVNGVPVVSGAASAAIAVGSGVSMINVVVTVKGVTRTYGIAAMQASPSYLKASNTGAADWFGYSVALSGDTLAVGAPYEFSGATGVNGNQADNSASYSGAVYVFVRTGTTWAQQAYLKASNTGAGDFFGRSVALSGDTLVVGAPYESSNAKGVNGNQTDNAAANSGAVYVFVRTGTTWVQQAYLKASNTGFNGNFGWSVALSGDTLAVGADGEDSNATGVNGDQADNSAPGSGAVYVF